MARDRRATPDAYFINQFGNPDNPRGARDDDRPGNLGADGGSSTRSCSASAPAARSPGCRATSSSVAPHVEIVLADPRRLDPRASTSTTARSTKTARGWSRASARISCRRSAISRVIRAPTAFPTRKRFPAARELLQKEGILAGSSTGTLLAGALQYLPRADRRRSASSRSSATPATSTSRRCTTTTGWWTRLHRARDVGDLRDLIGRPDAQHDTVVIGPTTSLTVGTTRNARRLAVAGDGRRQPSASSSRTTSLHVSYGDERVPRPGAHRDGRESCASTRRRRSTPVACWRCSPPRR